MTKILLVLQDELLEQEGVCPAGQLDPDVLEGGGVHAALRGVQAECQALHHSSLQKCNNRNKNTGVNIFINYDIFPFSFFIVSVLFYPKYSKNSPFFPVLLLSPLIFYFFLFNISSFFSPGHHICPSSPFSNKK